MKKKPKISVIIPAFNEERFLPRCLESLKNQNFSHFEIIVVDNNSRDKTFEVAKRFGAKVFKEKNQGVAFARQKGFLKARGKIIATSDADTILPRDWLSRILAEFEKDKDLVAFGGSLEFYSGPILVKLAVKYLSKIFFFFDRLISGGPNLMGCNMAIKKEAFLKIGGFNTNLKLNEDVEISYRLRKIGKIKFDPNFKVKSSGRRFRHGLIFGIINYAPTTIYRWIFKRFDRFQFFPPQRKEDSLIGKFSFPLTLIFILLCLVFHVSNPKIVLARILTKENLEKIILIEKKIQNKIKNDFSKIRNLKIQNERNFPHF